MFGIGTWELVLILAVATMILGPERCVQTARSFGKLWRNLRAELAAAKDAFEKSDDAHPKP